MVQIQKVKLVAKLVPDHIELKRQRTLADVDSSCDFYYYKKSAISRIENHAEDIRLSTLVNYAQALGKQLHLEVS